MNTAAQTLRWVSTEPGLDGLRLEPGSPPVPGAGELLVDVRAAALNFSDLLMIDGKYQVRPPRPFTPGQEIAGVVVGSGAGSRHQEGDRVAGKVLWGGFAERAILRDDMAIDLAPECSLCEGAALPVSYTTAYVALSECTRLAKGETVLVLAAAGGLGLAAVQIAAAMGATVIAAAGSSRKCEMAKRNGAAHAIDYSRPDWSASCRAITGEQGVDIVVDPVGGTATLEALRTLAQDGRLLIVGFSSGEIPAIPANRLLLKRIAAIGVYWNHDKDGPMLARVNNRMAEDLAAGAIRPVIEPRPGLASLPDALADLSARRTSGKVIIEIGGET